MKKLIIAEKPSLAQKIVTAIGGMKRNDVYCENEKYIVISVFGHLMQLCDLEEYIAQKETKKWELSDLNTFPQQFKWKVKDDKGIKQRYKKIEQLIKRNDVESIINAGDADREGEVLINVVVYDIFNNNHINKPIKRIWLEDQTTETIKAELSSLKDIFNTKNLYNEGLARTYVDWLYGIYLTRYISIMAKQTLPVGRVIIPTVKYVYDRCDEIKNFKSEKYYKINCTALLKSGEEINIDFADMKYNYNQKADAERLKYELQNNPIVVQKINKKETIKQPKRLFSLATLQNYMNKNNKWSLKKTLSVAQILYEKQLISYPRTNTEYLATQEKNKMQGIINKIKKLQKYENNSFELPSKIFDDSKIESHSAITITNKIISDYNELSEDEGKLYRVIFNRCLANFCSEKCVVDETKIKLYFKGYDKEYTTTISGQIIKQNGYLVYENDLQNKTVPNIKQGEKIFCKPEIVIKETKPPKYLSEKELNMFFEKPFKKNNTDEETTDEDYKNILAGVEIGTPATRADTIEKVLRVGYISKEKNNLVITEKGIALINILTKLNINLWAKKTAMLSQELKKIYKGNLQISDVVEASENEIKQIISQKINIENEINTAKEVIGSCPICNKPVYENSKAYGCSGYKDGCTFVIWKTIANKNITKNDAKDLLNPDKKETKMKKGFKSKTGKNFNAKLYLKQDNSVGFKFK